MSGLMAGSVATQPMREQEPSVLDQLAGELENYVSRLHHAVNRTIDNTDRLLGPQPPQPTEAKNATSPSLLAIDRIKIAAIAVDRLTDQLHDTNNRLSRL